MKIINHESRAGLKQILCRFKVFFNETFSTTFAGVFNRQNVHICTFAHKDRNYRSMDSKQLSALQALIMHQPV